MGDTVRPIRRNIEEGDSGQNVEETRQTVGERPRKPMSPTQNARATHQRLVLTDPAAFRYLEEDASTVVLERRAKLTGYELYIVEQWACSRKHPTFVITTYTGLEQHSIFAGVLSVPADEASWSPRLRVYLQAIKKYHARPKDTSWGTLMVTNLSGFPSSLNVIAIPDGDLKKHREPLFINEDLKRLQCSGRAGLNLQPPVSATEAKFRDLYHTSNKIPVPGAVIELVKLCQAALHLYGKLAAEYIDGLLCDVTEQAISDWWADIGSDVFNIDPADGILGPTTVAALLGLLMGARNRLHTCGAPVSKDVFDLASTKRAIAYFQKSQKVLERSRRLDRPTLHRLRRVTAKAANSEAWGVPRAVKSTMAELKGRGGEMTHGRDRASIAEIESVDIDDLIRLGSGERFKWLWLGKPRKHVENDPLSALDDGLIFNDDSNDEGWRAKRGSSMDGDISSHLSLSSHMLGSSPTVDQIPPDVELRRAVLKSEGAKGADGRRGLGRVRDALRRGHHHKYSKEINSVMDDESLRGSTLRLDDDSIRGSTLRESVDMNRQQRSDGSTFERSPAGSASQSGANSSHSSRRGSKAQEEAPREKQSRKPRLFRNNSGVDSDTNKSTSSLESTAMYGIDGKKMTRLEMINRANGIIPRDRAHRAQSDSKSLALTLTDSQAIDHMEHFQWAASKLPPLQRTKSLSILLVRGGGKYWERRYPRRMSFSVIVDAVYGSVDEDSKQQAADDPDLAIAKEKVLAVEARVMECRLQRLKNLETTWVENKVAQIEAWDQQCGNAQTRLDEINHQRLSEYQEMQEMLNILIADKRAVLTDAVKDVETLDAKLEYELQALQSKVEDVENGVEDFERHVVQLEARAAELEEGNGEQRSWVRRWLGLGFF